jgi:hypothetical protein
VHSISCPNSGWSAWIQTVGDVDDRDDFTRFFHSGGEVRPTNMAIKL